MESLSKLLEISSEPLFTTKPEHEIFGRSGSFVTSRELVETLSQKNGFLAFESALHVLSSESNDAVPGIREWNCPDGWRRHYRDLTDSPLFFAQDAFACQFGLTDSGIVKFEPESGEIARHSESLEAWASKILEDYSFETGWSLAHEWQVRHGALPIGHRLLPKQPFVLGGQYTVENLVAVESRRAMDLLGNLYVQIRDVPDGRSVTLTGWIA